MDLDVFDNKQIKVLNKNIFLKNILKYLSIKMSHIFEIVLFFMLIIHFLLKINCFYGLIEN
jgi:hypothetical protein